MKKILFPIFAFVSLTACNNDDNVTNQDINYSKLPQEFPFSTLMTLNGMNIINGGFGFEQRRILLRKVNFI